MVGTNKDWTLFCQQWWLSNCQHCDFTNGWHGKVCVCVCSKLNQFHYTKNKWHPLKFLDHSENEFELALLHPTSNRCHRIAVSFSVFICQRSLIIYVINETAHRVLTCNFSSLFICIIYDISTEYIHFASLKMFGFWLVIICSVDGQKQLNPTFFFL